MSRIVADRTPEWEPPQLNARAISQTHCHQHAIMGFGADETLMGRMGLDQQTLDTGCCGLAGNFGFEDGHHEVSMAVGERALLPAVREAGDTTIVTADGFSCRTQIMAGTPRRALHLVEVIALGLHGAPQGRPESATEDPQQVAARARLRGGRLELAAAGLVGAAALGALVRRRSR